MEFYSLTLILEVLLSWSRLCRIFTFSFFKRWVFMITSLQERTAIYGVAKLATDLNWIFREQPVADFGVDAMLETTVNGRPSGKYFGTQIKGGDKKTRRLKSGITIYISERHRAYWLSIAETMPMFLFFQDQSDGQIYWQSLSEETMRQTTKHWKIQIPYQNRLDQSFKEQIEDIVNNYQRILDWDVIDVEFDESNNDESALVHVSFGVKRGQNNVLCLL